MEVDQELTAMQSVLGILSELPDGEAQERVITYVTARLNLAGVSQSAKRVASSGEELETGGNAPSQPQLDTFADLFNVVSPTTNADKALVAAYWLQVVERHEQFASQAVNRLLQNLGYSLANVTDAFNQLGAKKPRLALQTRKSGKSQQARKQYKLTQAGIDAVKARLQGA
jgi:hypothetical protein